MKVYIVVYMIAMGESENVRVASTREGAEAFARSEGYKPGEWVIEEWNVDGEQIEEAWNVDGEETKPVCSLCVDGKVNTIEGGTVPCPKCQQAKSGAAK